MNNLLSAPVIDNYISMLGDKVRRNFNYTVNYDEQSLKWIDLIFAEIKKISGTGQYDLKRLWLQAPRGTLDEYKEYCEYGEAESEEQWNEWRDYAYPDETVWYLFSAKEDEKYKSRTISLGRRLVITFDPQRESTGETYEIAPLAEWMYESIKEAIKDLQNGTYNDRVQNELPLWHRTGIVVRKHIWDAYPKERAAYLKDLPTSEIDVFVGFIEKQPPDDMHELPERIQNITANDFYYFCSLGYAANKYRGTELTPKEQYYLHADGRDDDLKDVPGDDPKAFKKWLTERERGGHPWEVCRGGNSTHISLYPMTDKRGTFLLLDGDSWGRTIETVKFYLALKRKGIPVYLNRGDNLVARLLETENVGIVPKGVMPAYCGDYFRNEDKVIDYMNLDREDIERFGDKVQWYKEEAVTLLDEPSSVFEDIKSGVQQAIEHTQGESNDG